VSCTAVAVLVVAESNWTGALIALPAKTGAKLGKE
jgi:hypothetical protein